jgi:hypothetical protein
MNGYVHPSRLAARTIERHALIRGLIDQGHSQARIAREHRLDPRTVRRFAEADDVGLLLGRMLGRSSLLDEFKPYLLSRIQEGCTQANQLHAEIQARGWRGSVQTVRRFVFPLRTGPLDPVMPPPRPREIIGWIMTDPDHLAADDTVNLKDARSRCPELKALAGHMSAFAKMMLQLTGQDFPAWCKRVLADDLPAMHTLVNGFRRDQAAITAGLTLPYNSGAVEGAVTRIKALKRHGYGRANFDLLRKRILLTR